METSYELCQAKRFVPLYPERSGTQTKKIPYFRLPFHPVKWHFLLMDFDQTLFEMIRLSQIRIF